MSSHDFPSSSRTSSVCSPHSGALRSGGMVGNTPFNPYWGIYDSDAYAIALRSVTPAETYRATCDATGQNCVIPCGPDDDPEAELCPVPTNP